MIKRLEGKRGLVTGVMSKLSIAYWIVKALADQGAQVAVGCYTAHATRVAELLSDTAISGIFPFDAAIEGNTEAMMGVVGNHFGQVDFAVHSIANAPEAVLKGKFTDITLADFNRMNQVCVYSLIEMSRGLWPYLHSASTVLAMTFPPGSQGVMPGYNVGACKRHLEETIALLNRDHGREKGVVVGVGPTAVWTMASREIPYIKGYIEATAEQAPQGEVTKEDIASAVAGLVDGMALHMGGEIFNVDHGAFALGAMLVKSNET